MMKINVTIDVSREVLESIFITAIEGGSNYWYYFGESSVSAVNNLCPKASGLAFSERVFTAVYDYDAKVPIFDIEDTDGEPIGILDKSKFQERLELCAKENMWAIQEEIDERGDAVSSDAVFQYLVLNDLVYG
jgi:hypothetical protein